MLNSSKLLFVTMMVGGTILTVSSDNMLGMWMGLEINMISFIPLISKSNNQMASESGMIYFLVQSMGSILLLIMILSNSLIMVSSNFTNLLIINLIIFSMMIKLGAPPFHFWFPNMMQKMNWMNSFILMTWQKLAPLSILSKFMNNNMIMMLTMMAVIVGAIGGLNQTSLQKIMAYSSINHLGWMFMAMKFSDQLWMIYLLLYSIMVAIMVMVFNYYSMFMINQIMMNSLSLSESGLMGMSMLSLGGLPPFIGFLPKWMVIQMMMNSELYSVIIIMIMMSLLTLFYYIRVISTMLMINSSSHKWNSMKTNNFFMNKMLTINLILPLISLVNY
uniref:NADH-ubiquinone oxidoreductase chain 2 n=1 Tax=Phymata americana TaxID=1347736 RepID=A0A342CF60_9HEMI|nr:NADH dehydrogenase subunit 2 [Phymata americana]AGO27987.1 NADH dehydrogenase subunit 2 [Phymata americana]